MGSLGALATGVLPGVLETPENCVLEREVRYVGAAQKG